MKTNQEIFDIVANHLLTQNARSITHNADGIEQCRYRGDGGLRCAAGVLITDDAYSQDMEGYGVSKYHVAAALHQNGVVDGSLHLLRTLQMVHDENRPESWVNQLRAVARDYELSFNEDAYRTKADSAALYDLPPELPWS